jgi:signal transduction histidine kinase
MLTGLTHTHSAFRYLVLFFILLAIADALIGLATNRPFKKSSKLFALGGLIFSHIQLVVGLLLYFLGAKGFKAFMNAEGVMQDSTLRFFAVEHITMMILAVTILTIGYSKSKKKDTDALKHRTILWFYGVALVIIFIMIPWPFLKEFGRWM